MIADKSRRTILVYALLAVRTIVLGTPTALAANAEDAPNFTVDNGRFTMVAITSRPRMS